MRKVLQIAEGAVTKRLSELVNPIRKRGVSLRKTKFLIDNYPFSCENRERDRERERERKRG